MLERELGRRMDKGDVARCDISLNKGFLVKSPFGVLIGGGGTGRNLFLRWLSMSCPDTASVLSDGRSAGALSPDFLDLLAVSISIGANFRGGFLPFSIVGCSWKRSSLGLVGSHGRGSKSWVWLAHSSSNLPREFLRAFLTVVSTGSGLNFLGGDCLFASWELITVVSTGWGSNFRCTLGDVSTGSTANLRTGLGSFSWRGDTSLDDFTMVSIGSALKRLGGVADILNSVCVCKCV
jgi:hypothetical protein